MLQHEVESACDALCESLRLEDFLAPCRELLNDPDALTCELEVRPTDRNCLLVVVLLFLRGIGEILKLPNLLELGQAFLEAVGHVVDQAVEETLEVLMVHLIANLLSIGFPGPEAAEDLRARVPELKLCEEHSLARKFYVNVELDDSVHESAGDDW
jgi:hypothetical protein